MEHPPEYKFHFEDTNNKTSGVYLWNMMKNQLSYLLKKEQ